jgi:conserved oligomeric Golgi complex subunit 7
LEAVISPNGTSATGTGSLESICELYEATLQFLSLAYEAVAGGWHDVADATAVRGSAVYSDIARVFSRIASPFAAYQKSLPELEQLHSNISQTLITKDIQQSVGAIGSPSVTVLQDTAEKLKGLATYVFPIGDAAMGRLELMTGGYQVRKSLSTIDSILTNHAGELAIAIRTLSATMDACNLADIFDDQHVASSLEFLKVVGLYQSSLKQFEAKTRERMAVLQQRKVSHDMQEKEVTEKSFLLPDGLSIVEIDSILIKAAFADANDDPDVLERLAGAGSTLFPESNKAAERLKRSCQTLVFDVCSAVPRKQLANMSTMPCWTSSSNSLDSYGTLPQPYITQVGEHMLALVQALDPFASSVDSLAIAKEVMGGVREVALQPWKDLVVAAGVTNDSVAETLMKGSELSDYVNTVFEDDDELDEKAQDDLEKDKHDFSNQWLDVVGLAVTGRLLERILRIPRLTPKGCEHLSVDLNYLINVLAALGVSGHPHPLVNHFSEISALDADSLKAMIGGRLRNIPLVNALCSMEERLALMRGVSKN